MIRRAVSLLLLAWLLGFLAFALALPQPHGPGKTDALVVFTGGEGRIPRGLKALETGWAPRLFVSGVDREVRPAEFQAEYEVPAATMACCVTLGFESYDTRSNAAEVAAWLEHGGGKATGGSRGRAAKSVRLVTSDWHMRRSALVLERALPGDVTVVRDAVRTKPTFRILFLEYNKLLATFVWGLWES